MTKKLAVAMIGRMTTAEPDMIRARPDIIVVVVVVIGFVAGVVAVVWTTRCLCRYDPRRQMTAEEALGEAEAVDKRLESRLEEAKAVDKILETRSEEVDVVDKRLETRWEILAGSFCHIDRETDGRLVYRYVYPVS